MDIEPVRERPALEDAPAAVIQQVVVSSKATELTAREKWSALNVMPAAVTWAEVDAITAAQSKRLREPEQIPSSAGASSSGKSTEYGDVGGENTSTAEPPGVAAAENTEIAGGRKTDSVSSSGPEAESKTCHATTLETTCPPGAATKRARSMPESRPVDDSVEAQPDNGTTYARSQSIWGSSPQVRTPPDHSYQSVDFEPPLLPGAFGDFNYAPYWWLDGYKHPDERQWPSKPDDYEVPWYLEEEIRAANLHNRTHGDTRTCSAPGSPTRFLSRVVSEDAPGPRTLELAVSRPILARRARGCSLSPRWRLSETWMPDFAGSQYSMRDDRVEDKFFGDTVTQDYFVEDDIWSENVSMASDGVPTTPKLTTIPTGPGLGPPRPAPNVPANAPHPSARVPEKPTPASVSSARKTPQERPSNKNAPFVLTIAPNLPKQYIPTQAEVTAKSSQMGDRPSAPKKPSKKQKQKEREARRKEQALENRRRQEEAKNARLLENGRSEEGDKKTELVKADEVLRAAAMSLERMSKPEVCNIRQSYPSLADVVEKLDTTKSSPRLDCVDLEWPKTKPTSQIQAPPGINAPPYDIPEPLQVFRASNSHVPQRVPLPAFNPPFDPPPPYSPSPVPRTSLQPPCPGPVVRGRAAVGTPGPFRAHPVPSDPPPGAANAKGRILLRKIHAMAGNKGDQTGDEKELVTREVEIMRALDSRQGSMAPKGQGIGVNAGTEFTAREEAAQYNTGSAIFPEIETYKTDYCAAKPITRDRISDRQAEIERNLAILRPQIAVKQQAIDAKNQAKASASTAAAPQPTVWKPHAKEKDTRTFQPASQIRLEMQVNETELENCIIQYDAVKRMGENYNTWSLDELKYGSGALEEARVAMTRIYKEMQTLLLKAKNRELGWFDDLVVPDSFMEQLAELAERDFGRVEDLDRGARAREGTFGNHT